MNKLGYGFHPSYYGLGADKKKPDDAPVIPPIRPVKSTPGKGSLPGWAPYAVGVIGFAAIILILLTSKARD